MELINITQTLTDLTTTFKGEITKAAPVILGAVVLVAGVNLGLKWTKKLVGKIG